MTPKPIDIDELEKLAKACTMVPARPVLQLVARVRELEAILGRTVEMLDGYYYSPRMDDLLVDIKEILPEPPQTPQPPGVQSADGCG